VESNKPKMVALASVVATHLNNEEKREVSQAGVLALV